MRTKAEVKKDATDASAGITGRKTDEKASYYSSVAVDGSQNPREREAAMLFSVAEEHVDEDEDYDEALKAADEAVKIFREVGNCKGEADTLRLILHALAGKAEVYRWTERGDAETNLCGQTLKKAEERAQAELEKFEEAGTKIGEACMHFSLAELGMDARDVARRARSLEQALQAEALFREAGDKKLEADCMYTLSAMHLGKGNVTEGVEFCEGALEIYRELAARKEEGKTLHVLACALVSERFSDAVAAAKDALKIFRELDMKKYVAFELFCMAGWYVRRHQGKEALPLAKESLAIFQELGYGKGWVVGARDMVVEAQIAKGDKKQAMKTAKEGLASLEGSDDKRSQIFARKALANAYIEKDDLTDALLESETVLEQTRELEDKRWESQALGNVASLHIMNRAYDQASSAAQEAQQLLQDVGDKEGEAQILNRLCQVHMAKRDYKMAAQVAGEQRDLYSELGDKSREAHALLNLGEALHNDGKLDEALATATEAQALYQELSNKRGEGCSWNMIANVHQSNRMMDLAAQANMRMMSLFEEVDEKRLHAIGLKEMTRMHQRADEHDEAVKCATQARGLAKKSQDRYFEVEYLLLLADAYVGSLNKDMEATKKMPARSVMEKAMKAPKEAVLIAKKIGDKETIGYAQVALGRMYLTQGRFQDALKASDDAAKNFKTRNCDKGEVMCLYLSAQTYWQLDDIAKATDLCNKTIERAQAGDHPDAERDAAGLLELIQEKQNGGQQKQQYQQVEQQGQQQGQQQQSAAVPMQKAGLDPAVVTKMVKETLAASMGTDEDVDMDTPLMEAGMDSLSMVAFRNQLQRESGISMPASVMFDYPSMSGLVDHLVDSSRG